MIYRTRRKESRLSKWAQTLSMLAVQLAFLTIILHRFAGLDTPVALNLLAACVAGGAVAILLAIFAWISIWRKGHKGAGRAAFAIMFALPLFIYPAIILPKASALPIINDVTTDTANPPSFQNLAQERKSGANTTLYPGETFAQAQQKAYPDIQPITLERPTTETFTLVQEAVRRMKWQVVHQLAPGEQGSVGVMEAKDKTLLMGFVDDIAIRVTGGNINSRIDVRSASRYGHHDLGRNADRIRGLVAELQKTIVDADRAVAAKREARIKAEQKKKAELARRKALRKKRRAEAKRRAYRARLRRQRARERKKKQQWIFGD